MAKAKLYIYEDGACRGERFNNKTILNVDDVLALVEKGLKLKKTDKDAFEDFLNNNIYDAFEDYSTAKAMEGLVIGSDCLDEPTRTINARVKKLREGKPFYIFNEESTIGYAASKKEAREVCLCADGVEW